MEAVAAATYSLPIRVRPNNLFILLCQNINADANSEQKENKKGDFNPRVGFLSIDFACLSVDSKLVK